MLYIVGWQAQQFHVPGNNYTFHTYGILFTVRNNIFRSMHANIKNIHLIRISIRIIVQFRMNKSLKALRTLYSYHKLHLTVVRYQVPHTRHHKIRYLEIFIRWLLFASKNRSHKILTIREYSQTKDPSGHIYVSHEKPAM